MNWAEKAAIAALMIDGNLSRKAAIKAFLPRNLCRPRLPMPPAMQLALLLKQTLSLLRRMLLVVLLPATATWDPVLAT